MPHKKGTLLVPSGPAYNPDQKHLHIVCSDTCDLGLNLLVPVSSFYDGCDNTCELDVGDHEFIKHLSYVFYARANLYRSEQIDRGLERAILDPQPDLRSEVFVRVEAGLCTSPDTPARIKQYFGCF